jgi:hypothetical protein
MGRDNSSVSGESVLGSTDGVVKYVRVAPFEYNGLHIGLINNSQNRGWAYPKAYDCKLDI